jgi:hypothetical protein
MNGPPKNYMPTVSRTNGQSLIIKIPIFTKSIAAKGIFTNANDLDTASLAGMHVQIGAIFCTSLNNKFKLTNRRLANPSYFTTVASPPY